MDLRAIDPSFNLYNQSWPIRTAGYDDPPPKFVLDENGRRGEAVNSIVNEGTIISGSLIRGSVIGRNVRIHSYCLVEDSILMNRKYNIIPPGTEIGYDLDKDRERYFVSESGIVVIPRDQPKTA